MTKRIFALLLCVVMMIPVFASCGSKNEDDNGAYITMYLTEEIYDFDPLKAYYNSGTINVVSMLFETLFKLDENGKVVKGLAKDYEIIEENGEYAMEITLRDAKWSSGQTLTAEDVVYAWRRLLNQQTSHAAAALLFDIKNARAVKEGDEAADDLGVEALEPTILKITFEGKVNYDQFLLNLTSVVTAPLPESHVAKNDDWAKKASSMITSGPFKLGKIKYEDATPATLVNDDNAIGADGTVGTTENTPARRIEYFYLERNRHYRRDNAGNDPIDSAVTPYRILVDCTMTDDEILTAYNDGKLFYMSDIPLSLRAKDEIKNSKNLTVTDALSTTVCYLNLSIAPFNIPEVRQALSLAIDRNAIASQVVYAEAATGLVPPSVVNTTTGKKAVDFRDKASNALATTADSATAQGLIATAGLNPADYSFSIKVAAYDEVNCAVAGAVAASWSALGFGVTVEKVEVITNNDHLKSQGEEPKDVCDDLFIEALERNNFDVILFDSTAYTADAYSMLAGYAKAFSGMAINQTDYTLTPHRTGYDNADYNNLIEAIYYLPYFAGLNRDTGYQTFGEEFYTVEEFQAVYDAVKAVYDANGITPTTDAKKWADQKAILLHKAEEKLMQDLPVIPVIFNKNATLCSSQLKKVNADYYTAFDFQKTQLKNYNDYTYTVTSQDADGNTFKNYVSIFENFPEILWDQKGKDMTDGN